MSNKSYEMRTIIIEIWFSISMRKFWWDMTLKIIVIILNPKGSKLGRIFEILKDYQYETGMKRHISNWCNLIEIILK